MSKINPKNKIPTLTKKQKDDIFSHQIPNVLQYHQLMLSDGVRNKLLYEAIRQNVTSETNFLDIGAGTGVWAILAAKLGAKRVVAVEIEESLIPIIFRHAQENGVAHKVEIIHANSNDVKIRGKFDLIVSELFGNDALGESTIKSFVNLRNRFLAPNGILIPQKLKMFAVPSKIKRSVQDVPVDLPIKSEFLKSLKLNYTKNIPLSERSDIEFLGEPQLIAEVDFRSIETAPSLQNISLSWKLSDLSKVNSFTVFNQSTFTDELVMDSFHSQSWGTIAYEIKPFAEKEGEITFTLNMAAENTTWAVSLPSHQEIKTQTYSPIFAPTRLRMAQKMTPYRKFKPPKIDKNKKS